MQQKKIVKIVLIIFISLIILCFIIIYKTNEDIRDYVNYNVLRTEFDEYNSKQIDLSDEINSYIYSYDKYVIILDNNKLQAYNANGKKEFELDLIITEPLFESRKKYLAVAEKNGKKLYMISGKDLLWQTDVDGEIIKININKNGYVSLIVSQNTFETVVITYNSKGTELFKTYLSNTYAIDTDISSDNRYLAIAEINTDSLQVKSSIRIYSIEKIENKDENAIIYKKDSNVNQMITGIKYNDANYLIAMYDNGIDVINNTQNKTLVEFNSENTLFANIELDKAIVETVQTTKENAQANTKTYILNTTSNSKREFDVDSIPKEIVANSNYFCINTGTEAYFVSDKGWLKRKYKSKQEMKQVILGEKIAAIIYKNKINLLEL